MERDDITTEQAHLLAKLLLAQLVRRIQHDPYPLGAALQLRAHKEGGLSVVLVGPSVPDEEALELLAHAVHPASRQPFPDEFYDTVNKVMPDGNVEDHLTERE